MPVEHTLVFVPPCKTAANTRYSFWPITLQQNNRSYLTRRHPPASFY